MENRHVADSENLSKALDLIGKLVNKLFYAIILLFILFFMHIVLYFGTDYEIPEPNITNTNTNTNANNTGGDGDVQKNLE